MTIKIKSKEQIEIMREGGRITAGALRKVFSAVEVGIATAELDKIAEDFILKAGGEPAFKRVPGYDFATCLNLNEGVVHGLPSGRTLKEGDILSVDLGTYYKGLNTDISWTHLVGPPAVRLSSPSKSGRAGRQADQVKLGFLETGERALWAAIEQCRPGNKVGDISAAMEKVLRRAGYSPVVALVGHGIGEELHEEPQIPCLVVRGENRELREGRSPAASGEPRLWRELVEGMALAVEVIYTMRDPALKTLPDGWTVVTVDGSLAGLFEHTVVIGPDGPIVLTALD